ncbi:hypothetical protein FB107DRAFT_280571 [Schizophyllum commune]
MGAARSAAEGADIEPFSTLFRRPNNAKSRLRADGRAGAFARRGTERRRHSTAQLTRNFANRRQMRRGPRGNPSLTAATCTLDHVREVEGLHEQQRSALPAFQQQEFLDPFRAERFANRRQMDRDPRLKFWLMFATVEGGEGARSASYIVVYTLPCGRWLAHISLPRLKLCRAIQELAHDLRRPLKDRSGSEATYQRPASEDSIGIAILPLFSLLVPPSHPLLPPFFPSSVTLVLHPATLFEPPAPLATPSTLVSTSLNISQPLGADVTLSAFEGASLRGVISRALPFDALRPFP